MLRPSTSITACSRFPLAGSPIDLLLHRLVWSDRISITLPSSVERTRYTESVTGSYTPKLAPSSPPYPPSGGPNGTRCHLLVAKSKNMGSGRSLTPGHSEVSLRVVHPEHRVRPAGLFGPVAPGPDQPPGRSGAGAEIQRPDHLVAVVRDVGVGVVAPGEDHSPALGVVEQPSVLAGIRPEPGAAVSRS